MDKLEATIHDAAVDNPMWWGNEAKTGHRLLENLNKDVVARIKKTAHGSEVQFGFFGSCNNKKNKKRGATLEDIAQKNIRAVRRTCSCPQ